MSCGDLFGSLTDEFNVLSLFDGMSCGQIALNRIGIDYDKYFASEIDKNAIKVTQHNYPNTIQVGDATQLSANNLPRISLLMGGSPCQGFSSAGKGLNFDDPRSKLFFEYVRLKNELNPKYFLLENVNMKKEWRDIISDQLGVEPVNINSQDFSAQMRNRWYWTNLPIFEITQSSAVIGDILEKTIPVCPNDVVFNDSFYRSSKGQRSRKYVREGLRFGNQKARCLTRMNAGSVRSTGGTCVAEPDGYTQVAGVPRGASYQMLGNGWTVDVIAHILSGIKRERRMALVA